MLMLSALLGMFFMISSGNLLMFYLSLELSTIPLAALANFDLDKKTFFRSSMKMIIVLRFFFRIIIVWYFIVVWSNRNIEFCRTTSIN